MSGRAGRPILRLHGPPNLGDATVTDTHPEITPGPAGGSVPGLPPLGAHVSVAGGLARAVERGIEIGATALQVFTGQPQRWAEPDLGEDDVRRYRDALAGSPIGIVASHDSYLINLATERAALLEKSRAAFEAELERCQRLGIDHLVTHPGNATGGDREAALRQNAAAIGAALLANPGPTTVLVETTAGSGTALGWRFEELATLIDAVPADVRGRVGVCMDTAHVFAAGYDLRTEYGEVMDAFDRTVGLERLHLFHVNDSRAGLGSRVDRHAHLGEGELGEAGFVGLMRDSRFVDVPRILETPKDDDGTAADRRNLDFLRRLARGA
ncbi:MAG: deoxyribonuclease IV [Candidatus Palauibacterales bacterium]|nr:deoxyribonuclease IV [Candidatus Palauibacterales bacterium]MDP2529675.1 deoxyribonuclease IV [Candidatus Palauibacterales bacterium]MDP2584091.1 deoxyribonuclease IV [Candidatus Palauibacterales bacterium]